MQVRPRWTSAVLQSSVVTSCTNALRLFVTFPKKPCERTRQIDSSLHLNPHHVLGRRSASRQPASPPFSFFSAARTALLRDVRVPGRVDDWIVDTLVGKRLQTLAWNEPVSSHRFANTFGRRLPGFRLRQRHRAAPWGTCGPTLVIIYRVCGGSLLQELNGGLSWVLLRKKRRIITQDL